MMNYSRGFARCSRNNTAGDSSGGLHQWKVIWIDAFRVSLLTRSVCFLHAGWGMFVAMQGRVNALPLVEKSRVRAFKAAMVPRLATWIAKIASCIFRRKKSIFE